MYVSSCLIDMSAQCWCYDCSGKLVDRRTFVRHGRKTVPDPPVVREDEKVEVVSAPDDDDDDAMSWSDSSSGEDCDDGDEGDTDEWSTAAWDNLLKGTTGDRFGRGQLTPAHVLLLFLDWMSANKTTDAAAGSVWGLLSACTPGGTKLPTFRAIKRMLVKNKDRIVRRIDICRNDCIAFYDTKHLPEQFRSDHAHRTHCPICGADRFITDPVTGALQAVKVVYHFPLAPFVRGLYARPDLVPYLLHDCGDHPASHITRSRGFRRKVLDNPVINRWEHIFVHIYTRLPTLCLTLCRHKLHICRHKLHICRNNLHTCRHKLPTC